MEITDILTRLGGVSLIARELGVSEERAAIGAAAAGTAGAGGLASLLDLNRDGNPLDDILSLAGTALR